MKQHQFNVNLEDGVHRKLKVYCMMKGETMSSVLAGMIGELLKEKNSEEVDRWQMQSSSK